MNADAIQSWIVDYVADVLALDPHEVDVDKAFDGFGLDSVTAVGMTGALEDWLGKRVDPMIIYQHPTIATLAVALASS